ncbi:hypothetical protein P154DRAFT_459492, partial [Amniculicola lignicola CBS 123094]
MVRHNSGFVSKRPHKKSRGGCATCRRKKVKCDEGAPKCNYCAIRQLDCIYTRVAPAKPTDSSPYQSSNSDSQEPHSVQDLDDETIEFNYSSYSPSSALIPKIYTSSGILKDEDIFFLHHYRTHTYSNITVRNEEIIHHINRDWVPQASISKPFLLYTLLSISASHSNSLVPSPQKVIAMDTYRQKALSEFNKALQNITDENYESLLLTSLFMQIIVPPPNLQTSDSTSDTILNWLDMFLSMTQGLRILAGLKWESGIEHLTVYPAFRREIRTLPPPPAITMPIYHQTEPPNPPSSYKSRTATPPPPVPNLSNLPFETVQLMSTSGAQPYWALPTPAFLPPCLTLLLQALVSPPKCSDAEGVDIHPPTLLPALHALSPLFRSLYHFGLSPDLYTRIFVYPTYLPPEFLQLVRMREARALVIISWWLAFVALVPQTTTWWMAGLVPRVLECISAR